MRMLNELAEHPLMKKVRGSDTTDDEQVQLSSTIPHECNSLSAILHDGKAWQWLTGAISPASVAIRVEALWVHEAPHGKASCTLTSPCPRA